MFMANEESGTESAQRSGKARHGAGVTSVTNVQRIGGKPDEAQPADFPIEALPPQMAEMVKEVARVGQIPLSMPACCALGAVSASIGKGVAIRSAEHRLTRGNIYIVVGARSGEGKSECFRPILKPIVDFEREALETLRDSTLPNARAMKEVLEAQIRNVKAKLRTGAEPADLKHSGAELAELMSQKERVDQMMRARQLICEDVTAEKLAVLLGDNDEALFSASPDAGAALNNLLGRYSTRKRTDESIYLKAYSGDLCRVDRIARRGVDLNEPCLTLLWLVQPDKLDTLFGERSLSEGGLLPRILPCLASTSPARIDRTIGPVPAEVETGWRELLRRLLQMYHHRRGEPQILQPSAEAVAKLDEHQHRLVDRRAAELADVYSYPARWNEWAWRLTVVLHTAKYGDEAHNLEVRQETAEVAIRLADWFSSQQLDLLDRSRVAAKREKEREVYDLLRHLAKQESSQIASITARDVQRARIALSSEEANELLTRMEAEGKLAGEDHKPASGGHISRRYWMPPHRK
jgi:replicative DNA helicase